MIEFNLSPVISTDRQEADDISAILSDFHITEYTHPKIYLFLTNPESFYLKYCQNIDNFIAREKRFLDFENPNRVLVTREYDIILPKNFDYGKIYFLFNPYRRLGWLKIYQGQKRIVISSQKDVKRHIIRVLADELYNLHDSAGAFTRIWNAKKGLPCFIRLVRCKEDSFILSATYYETIEKKDSHKRLRNICNFMNPFDERYIDYDYLPLQGRSCWLYIKAPEHFNVRYDSCSHSDNNVVEVTTLTAGKDPDIEKISLTIINKDNHTQSVPKVLFRIIIPHSLKSWFLVMYILSLIVMIMSLSSCLNRVWLKFFNPIFQMPFNPDFLDRSEFGAILIAIVAAIITTRGWLIHEETILRKFATRESIFLIISVISYLLGIFLK